VLNTVISKPTDGILVPIPQYPIYSALIRLLDGELIGCRAAARVTLRS
jgi:aspartate/methionine/tyrosine aminotransferase